MLKRNSVRIALAIGFLGGAISTATVEAATEEGVSQSRRSRRRFRAVTCLAF